MFRQNKSWVIFKLPETRSIFFLGGRFRNFPILPVGVELGWRCLMHLTQKLGEIAAAAEKMRDCGDNSAIGANQLETLAKASAHLFEASVLFCSRQVIYILTKCFLWVWTLLSLDLEFGCSVGAGSNLTLHCCILSRYPEVHSTLSQKCAQR